MYKRASLAYTARQAETKCPPEVTLIDYKGDKISVYPTDNYNRYA